MDRYESMSRGPERPRPGSLKARGIEIGAGLKANEPTCCRIPDPHRTEGRVRGRGRALARTTVRQRELSELRGYGKARIGTAAGAYAPSWRTARPSDRLG